MFVNIASQSTDGAPVSLKASVGGLTRRWEGKLVRSEGVLDTGSRVVYAIVEVKDPYNMKGSHSAPIRFGQFVEAEITSRQNEALMVLPRSILRLDNTVLTVNENREIEIKPVEVARTTAKEVFIRSGVEEGSLVVTSAVPNPYNGMKVRLPGDEPVASEETTDGEDEAIESNATGGGR